MNEFLKFFDDKTKDFPMHLEIAYSKICDWNILIYKKGCADDYPKARCNGEDVNPNEENEKIIEITSPKITNIAEETDDSDEDDDFETEVKSEELPNSYNIEELRAKALEVRDKLREEKDDDEVRKILKESLGTVRIKTYEDAGKLNDFIKKYE